MSQSEDAFEALKDFYDAFPTYRSNELYITGESYAGIYGPYLAWQIHQWNLYQKMNQLNDTYNLAGFIIGNGYTDPYSDSNVLFPQTLFNMNMISQTLFNQITSAGCVWYWDKLDISPHVNAPECDGYWSQLNSMLANVNLYDLYRTNYGGSLSVKAEKKVREGKTTVNGETRTYKRGHTLVEMAPWLKSLLNEDHPVLT